MKDLRDLLTILGITSAIICGLLLGMFITMKSISYFIESLKLFS